MEHIVEIPFWIIEDLIWSEKVLNSDACYDSIREAQKTKNVCLNELQLVKIDVDYLNKEF